MSATACVTDSVVADAYFSALSNYVIATTGLEYFVSRQRMLAGHVAARLERLGITGCCDYLRLLQEGAKGEAELDELIALLTIGETYFFRHRELFEALRNVAIPDIIKRNQSSQRLRIWSAGCSTGAEAYSISILLRREFSDDIRGWNVSIVGTDINRPFLAQAVEGRYDEWAFRGTTPEFRRECFTCRGKSWLVAPQFRDGVTFQYHNMARHPFPSLVHNLVAFDLILCRNVLIYFAPEIATAITAKLAECLVPAGWLAVGHAEHGLHLQRSFDVLDCGGATVYRKQSPATHRNIPTESIARFARADLRQQNPLTRHGNSLPAYTSGEGGPHIPHPVAPLPTVERSKNPAGLSTDRIRKMADNGEIAEALELCESRIAKNRLDPFAHYYRALLLEQIERHDEALAALGKAIYLKRDYHLAHYYLGLTQQKLGRTLDAIRSFRNVLNILSGLDPSQCLPDAEGLTVADLDDLARIHLESLEAA